MSRTAATGDTAQLAIAEKFMAVLVSEMQEVPPASWFVQLRRKLVNARTNERGKKSNANGDVYEGDWKEGNGLDALANVARKIKKEHFN